MTITRITRTNTDIERAIEHLEKALAGAAQRRDQEGVDTIDHLIDLLHWFQCDDNTRFARVLAEFEKADVEIKAILSEMQEEGPLQ
jgi:hypothetical protein